MSAPLRWVFFVDAQQWVDVLCNGAWAVWQSCTEAALANATAQHQQAPEQVQVFTAMLGCERPVQDVMDLS